MKGENGFIGIEVKYSEDLKDEPSSHKARYEELATASNLFIEGSFKALTRNPVQQIWRDHLLAIAILQHENNAYSEGMFMYLYPGENQECVMAIQKYQQQFKTFCTEAGDHDREHTGFYPICLKAFMLKLRDLNKEQWTSELLKRYFDHAE